jgi:hypothetical protein
MDIVEREREHLAEADRHIAQAKQKIELQKKVIEKLVQDGHETSVAESLLHATEHSLLAFEEHREAIIETMKTLKAVKATKSRY